MSAPACDPAVAELLAKTGWYDCQRLLQAPDIDLTQKFIGDDRLAVQGLAVVLKQNNVVNLDLYENSLDDEDVRILAGGLEGNTSLGWLGLWFNQISDDSAATLAHALPSMTGLTSLNLQHTMIDLDGRALLVAAKGPNLKEILIGNGN